MVVGIIGVGAVGGTLNKWFVENTDHEIRLYDPAKGHLDFLTDCEAIFISVPVPESQYGQDQTILEESVKLALSHCDKVFIRSTVLPGTNDKLGTISMPEFLTEATAFSDMCKYPILCGETDLDFVQQIFPGKKIMMMANIDCEFAKFAHNCFGAMKVTYFNMIYDMAKAMGGNYEKIREGYSITGFIEQQHTNIAPDGNFGYGGKCFPTNIKAMMGWLWNGSQRRPEANFFYMIDTLNNKYRAKS
jgi:UDP-glucose 6-dehydrogenase